MKRTILLLIAFIIASALGLSSLGCTNEVPPATTSTSLDTAPSSSITETTSAPLSYATVSVNETFDRLSTVDDAAQIVDVREPSEWETTGVPVGAVLISLDDLEQNALTELTQDKPVYVICNSGNRSRVGAQILIDLGYAEVYNVDGGIQAWLAAGLPVTIKK